MQESHEIQCIPTTVQSRNSENRQQQIPMIPAKTRGWRFEAVGVENFGLPLYFIVN